MKEQRALPARKTIKLSPPHGEGSPQTPKYQPLTSPPFTTGSEATLSSLHIKPLPQLYQSPAHNPRLTLVASPTSSQ